MTREDLPSVNGVASAAFGALRGHDIDATGEHLFSPLLFETRFAADPEGCLVAVLDSAPERIAGAVLSVARGTLAWFGPLAVHPSAQRGGAGALLVDTLLDRWRSRGVALMGLETFATSEFHVRFYGRFGFRPSWTGLAFTKQLSDRAGADPPVVEGGVGGLDFLYPGLDVAAEATVTGALGAGIVLAEEKGLALCHLRPTFQGPEAGYVPFLAARDAATFHRLLDAVEHRCREAGRSSLFVRTSGSSWATLDALAGRGYVAGGAMVRMKLGAEPDYDRGERFYLDNWL